MTLEHIAIVDFGLALNEVFQIGRLFFLRHLPFNSIETGSFLADRGVLNRLTNRKLKRHLVPFVLGSLSRSRQYLPGNGSIQPRRKNATNGSAIRIRSREVRRSDVEHCKRAMGQQVIPFMEELKQHIKR